MSPIGFSLFTAMLLAQPVADQASTSAVRVTDSQEYNRIIDGLDADTQLKLVNATLSEALQQLAAQHHLNFVVDNLALREAQKEFEVERNDLSLIVSNLRLRSALKMMLEPLELDYVIDDEVIIITTKEAALSHQGTHVYDVSALVKGGTVASLAEAVRTALPSSVQRSASISGYRNLMLVTGNRQVHENVSKMLRLINDGIRDEPVPTPIPTY